MSRGCDKNSAQHAVFIMTTFNGKREHPGQGLKPKKFLHSITGADSGLVIVGKRFEVRDQGGAYSPQLRDLFIGELIK